jgi:iron complex outermembrane receptor protein
MAALQNLTGVRYVGSVSVNATGGKFYEPAPGRTLLLRLSIARATDTP